MGSDAGFAPALTPDPSPPVGPDGLHFAGYADDVHALADGLVDAIVGFVTSG